MAWKESASQNHTFGIVGFFIHTLLRFFQFVLALTVIGLYGQDLNNARKAGVYADPKWVYAVVVGSLAALCALIYMVPWKTYIAFGWDAVMFILWIALFGLFGNIYIKANPKGDAGVQRMKNAVWVDLANALLWLLTAAYGAALFMRNRNRKSLHTGRANV